MHSPAVVMNVFYTGLGIARSLGRSGIPVVGLTAQRGIYGNHTRYARTVSCPDSRNDPEGLLEFLLRMGEQTGQRSVIFPTRDDDVVFLDRFRGLLEKHYSMIVPSAGATAVCLDKWRTYLCAQEAGVAVPACWLVTGEDTLIAAANAAKYPCVLKPLAAHHWRQGRNWEIVGERKAIQVHSREELLREYAITGRADKRALLQELIPGGDEALVVTACYIDRNFGWAGSFNVQKLRQEPEGFGTGCIVQTTRRPELLEPTQRLLKQMQFSGIAEVEYKWDSRDLTYKLIEVNPRPWDQHSLGQACGVDLIQLAYRDHAGLTAPLVKTADTTWKWIADDAFVMAAARSIRRHDGSVRTLLRSARGKRIYGIWSARDPLPFVLYFGTRLIPKLASASLKRLWSRFTTSTGRAKPAKGGSLI